MSEKLTAFQRRALLALSQMQHCSHSPGSVAYCMGLDAVRYRLVVAKALNACAAGGFVTRIPPRDQWSAARYTINDAGRSALSQGGE